MDILLILSCMVFGFALGELYASYKIMNLIKKFANDEGIDIEEEIEKSKQEKETKFVKKLVVEQHNDVLYLYDRDSNDFVCQASSIEELAKLSKEYKNVAHAVVLHNNKVFMFINGVCKEYVA